MNNMINVTNQPAHWLHDQWNTPLSESLQGWFDMQHVWMASYDVTVKQPGGRLNKKDGLTRYGNSHVKDKTS